MNESVESVIVFYRRKKARIERCGLLDVYQDCVSLESNQ